VIDADSRKEILTQQIYDKGDYSGNTGFLVETDDSGMTLRMGSSVKHEPFATLSILCKQRLQGIRYMLLFPDAAQNL
jgi:hypothetical protein